MTLVVLISVAYVVVVAIVWRRVGLFLRCTLGGLAAGILLAVPAGMGAAALVLPQHDRVIAQWAVFALAVLGLPPAGLIAGMIVGLMASLLRAESRPAQGRPKAGQQVSFPVVKQPDEGNPRD